MPQASSWLVVERCLALLVRLMREPATTQEMLDIVRGYGDVPDNASRKALKKRLEGDIQKLREIFGCDLAYDPQETTYTLITIDRPLIDLPTDALRGLAFLHSTFSDTTAPMCREVLTLVDRLLMLMSESRREDITQIRGLIEVDLQQRDSDYISDDVLDTVQRACTRHRELEFEYLSPKRADGIPLIYRVEPLRCYFDTTRGHYYLEAYCIENRGPNGTWPIGKISAPYRIGRISNPRVLPTRFAPGKRTAREYELVYELTPEVARLGVTQRIANSQIEKRPNGSAMVHAMSTDLFSDLRALLHYGPACRVIGGEEARKGMQELVRAMYEQYSR